MSQNLATLSTKLSKGKAQKDISHALNDLRDLLAFHQRVSIALGTSLQHLADSLFVHMSNMILLRRDSYLDFVKPGVKQDTMNTLRNAPMFGYALFLDAAIITAEQDIQKAEAASVARGPGPGAGKVPTGTSPMTVGIESLLVPRIKPHRLNNSRGVSSADTAPEDGDMVEGPTLVFPGPSHTNTQNDNYCLNPNPLYLSPVRGDLCCQQVQYVNRQKPDLDVSCHVVFPAPSVHFPGPPQRKGVSPVPCQSKIKHVKDVCCVDHCLSAQSVPNVPSAAAEQNVGGRLQKFWQVWQAMGANPRVVSILKEGYSLPFKQRPLLTRFPLVKRVINPTKNRFLKDSLVNLMVKLVVEKVIVQSSLTFYNRLFLVPKPNGKWRPILDLSQLNLFLKTGTFKMETPGDNPIVPSGRGMGHVTGLQRRLLPHPNCPKVKKISQVLPVQPDLSVHGSSLQFGHSTSRVHQGGQGSKTDGSSKGYSDPPVPRRLVTTSPFPGDLPTQYPDPLVPLPKVRMGSKYGQVRANSQTGIQLRRLPVRPSFRTGPAHSRPVEDPTGKVAEYKEPTLLYGLTVHVPHRLVDSNRKTGQLRPSSYETDSVAFEEKLAHPRNFGEDNSDPSGSASSSGLVAGRITCPKRSTSTPSSTCRSDVYRRLTRRLGLTLRGLHGKRCLVPYRKSPSHKLPRTESSTSSSQTVRASLQESDCACCDRQHDGGLIHQQTRGYEFRLSLFPPVEAPILVSSQGDCPESQTHLGRLNVIADKLSRHNQIIQTEWSLSQQVFDLLSSKWGRPQVDLFATRFNYKLPQFVSPVPDPTAWGVDALSLTWEQLEAYAFRPVSLIPQVISKLRYQGCRRMILIAQHALVLGSSQLISSDPVQAPSGPRPGIPALQRAPTQEPHTSQSPCLAPRIDSIQKHGFSQEVATRIEAPQRSSTRAVYKSKWAVFTNWCKLHKVDFRSPSIAQIADFLLYLFKERNVQPGTIEGYRTAIADMVGNDGMNISTDANLTCLLDSFHRDKPKGRRGVPAWNLSLVLSQLTKPPFEPLRKASLKHLTFKTVFRLALGSGKRRSEIHAWLYKNIRHQENWTQVSLYPSPSFLSKNQLAKDGPTSISSWIKQTVILCYQLSDQKSQDLHQVRAHDVRAFAASQAFRGGILLDQIL